jgi:hypothetical protein
MRKSGREKKGFGDMGDALENFIVDEEPRR